MNEIPENWHDTMWSIATRVQAYTGGSIGWIAKQRVSDHQPFDDLFGFVVGKGFASIRLPDAENADDATIRALATEILGYAPGSIEDYEAKRKDAIERASEIGQTIVREGSRLDYFLSVARGCEMKLDELRSADHE